MNGDHEQEQHNRTSSSENEDDNASQATEDDPSVPMSQEPPASAQLIPEIGQDFSKPEKPRPHYKLRYVLSGHTMSVSSVKFSPDGKLLASCCEFVATFVKKILRTVRQPLIKRLSYGQRITGTLYEPCKAIKKGCPTLPGPRTASISHLLQMTPLFVYGTLIKVSARKHSSDIAITFSVSTLILNQIF